MSEENKLPLFHSSGLTQWCWCPVHKTQAVVMRSGQDLPICRVCKQEMVRRYKRDNA